MKRERKNLPYHSPRNEIHHSVTICIPSIHKKRLLPPPPIKKPKKPVGGICRHRPTFPAIRPIQSLWPPLQRRHAKKELGKSERGKSSFLVPKNPNKTLLQRSAKGCLHTLSQIFPQKPPIGDHATSRCNLLGPTGTEKEAGARGRNKGEEGIG